MNQNDLSGRRAALLGVAGLAAATGAATVAAAGAAQAQTPARPATPSPATPSPSAPPAAAAPGAWTLEQVATFEDQVTGVAVSPDGRIFVNFPRWEKDVAVSVAEVGRDGSLKPYPNAEWNSYRNRAPKPLRDHFVCVQSVTVDSRGALWILDPAAPGNAFNLPGGPKLLKVDLTTNAVVLTVPFDTAAAPQGSYLNDVRISPDGLWAYITDSGRRGALVVVDLVAGTARRVLDGHPATQVEPGVVVKADGRELRRTDGRPTEFAADGIALDAEGRFLYWQALTGKTLYRLPTEALRDAAITADRLAGMVEKVGETGVADGLWMDREGRIFVTSPEEDALKLRAADGSVTVIARDRRLRWPDSLAQGADGAIYVTASRIQDMAQYHEDGVRKTVPYALFKVTPPRAG